MPIPFASSLGMGRRCAGLRALRDAKRFITSPGRPGTGTQVNDGAGGNGKCLKLLPRSANPTSTGADRCRTDGIPYPVPSGPSRPLWSLRPCHISARWRSAARRMPGCIAAGQERTAALHWNGAGVARSRVIRIGRVARTQLAWAQKLRRYSIAMRCSAGCRTSNEAREALFHVRPKPGGPSGLPFCASCISFSTISAHLCVRSDGTAAAMRHR